MPVSSTGIRAIFGILAGVFLINLFENWRAIFMPFNVIFLLAALAWAMLIISSRYATEYVSAISLSFYSSLCTALFFAAQFFILWSCTFGGSGYEFLDSSPYCCTFLHDFFNNDLLSRLICAGCNTRWDLCPADTAFCTFICMADFR